jgi:hypothetical protein
VTAAGQDARQLRAGRPLSLYSSYLRLAQFAQRQFEPHLQSEQLQPVPHEDFGVSLIVSLVDFMVLFPFRTWRRTTFRSITLGV